MRFLTVVETRLQPLEGRQHLVGVLGRPDRLSRGVEGDDPVVGQLGNVSVVERDVRLLPLPVRDRVFRNVAFPGGDFRRQLVERPLLVFEQRVTEVPTPGMAERLVDVVQLQ